MLEVRDRVAAAPNLPWSIYKPDRELSHLVVLPKSASGLAADALNYSHFDGVLLGSVTSAKPVGVGAVCQRWILAGERSSLLTRIGTTVNASLCMRMKS